MKHRFWSGVVLAAALAAPIGVVTAQGVVVGTPNSGNCIPFGCQTTGYTYTRYQQVYSASAFSGPLSINYFGFGVNLNSGYDPNGGIQAGTYTFYFSTTTAPVNGLSSNLDANVTGPEQLFATFIADGGPSGQTLTINGDTPYAYDPSAGNLLLDVHIAAGPAGPGAAMGYASDYTGAVTSRAYSSNPTFQGTPYADQSGLVTSFNQAPLVAAITPEPSSLALMATGLLAMVPVVQRRRRA